jgi:plasmid stabilization system protein ParE
MAELIWTEPALSDLDAIADYIELDNPEAARGLVQRVFQHVEQLAAYPESGSRPRELRGFAVSTDRRAALSNFLSLRRRTSLYSIRHARRDALARETSLEKRAADS